MTTYLTIMVTVLVATQVIRITQNAIQLHKLGEEITKEDVAMQKENNRLLNKWLKENMASD